MKKFFVFSFILLTSLLFVSCNNKPDNLQKLSTNLSNYEISIELDTTNYQAKVEQNVAYVNNTGEILRNVKFHLYPQYFEEGSTSYVVGNTNLNNAYPNGMSYATFDVTRVSENNNDSDIIFENEQQGILSVNLSNSLLPNEIVIIKIWYEFTLPNCEHRFGYGENTINLCNFYPIACVYENGQFNTSPYNSNGDPFYSEMSNYSVSLTLPEQYIVAHTGQEISKNSTENGLTHNFEAVMVRDFALVISDRFLTKTENYKQTQITYFYLEDENPDQSLKTGMDAIKTFSNLFGTYPYSAFNMVECDFIFGGMEYPNLILLSNDIEDDVSYQNVIVHETAHQWWYGMVGNDQYNFPWLDEALTEFSTLLFYDNNEGYQLNHEQMVKSTKENYTMFISVYTDVLGNIDTSMRAVNLYSTEPEYVYCTYVKGVLMYESLYQLIGKDKFLSSLKIYFSNNKYKNAQPQNLFEAFCEGSDQNLEKVFLSWLSGKVVIR